MNPTAGSLVRMYHVPVNKQIEYQTSHEIDRDACRVVLRLIRGQ